MARQCFWDVVDFSMINGFVTLKDTLSLALIRRPPVPTDKDVGTIMQVLAEERYHYMDHKETQGIADDYEAFVAAQGVDDWQEQRNRACGDGCVCRMNEAPNTPE